MDDTRSDELDMTGPSVGVFFGGQGRQVRCRVHARGGRGGECDNERVLFFLSFFGPAGRLRQDFAQRACSCKLASPNIAVEHKNPLHIPGRIARRPTGSFILHQQKSPISRGRVKPKSSISVAGRRGPACRWDRIPQAIHSFLSSLPPPLTYPPYLPLPPPFRLPLHFPPHSRPIFLVPLPPPVPFLPVPTFGQRFPPLAVPQQGHAET